MAARLGLVILLRVCIILLRVCLKMTTTHRIEMTQYALKGRVFKNRIKIWYKKWCYIGVSKLLIFNTLTYKIALCKFA
jgi:hypothetical protein